MQLDLSRQKTLCFVALLAIDAVIKSAYQKLEDKSLNRQLAKVMRWQDACFNSLPKITSKGAERDLERCFISISDFSQYNKKTADQILDRWCALVYASYIYLFDAINLAQYYTAKKNNWRYLYQTYNTLTEAILKASPTADAHGTYIYEVSSWKLAGQIVSVPQPEGFVL